MSQPCILMYHGFGTRTDSDDPWRLFVPVADFDRQLGYLQARGANFLNLDRYLAGMRTGRWPERSVLVTIDDGYVSVLGEAAPVLARRGVPAVLFALGASGGTSGWMTEMPDEPLLDPGGLRELGAYGVEVGVHGWDHRLLAGLSADELHRQVVQARSRLADMVGYLPRAFAYPCGQHDAAARDAVRAAGYPVAFAVHDGQGCHAVPRTDVNATDTELTFRLKTTRWWPTTYTTLGRIAPLRRSLHTLLGSARR